MKHTLLLVAVVSGFAFLIPACKKEGVNTSNNAGPANLNIIADVSTDGSGKVNFKATADDAASFVFEFGNGEIRTVPTGVVTYQYTLLGNNTYTVIVTAYNNAGKTSKKQLPVTVKVLANNIPGLIWSDEFNQNGAPDASKWGYDIGTGAGGWGNAELQYYTNRPENAVVRDGVLRITAIKENFSGSAYTSARLLTRGKFSFKYGKVEVRAKMPAGGGTWPAAWMLGNNIGTVGWPNCGEIDILEHKGNEPNRIFGTLHYPGRFGGNPDGSSRYITNATTEFHIYSVEWTVSSIRFFVDGQLYHTAANSSALPFNQEFFLLVNLAMGGTFGGNVDPAFTSATYEIDYIRVFN